MMMQHLCWTRRCRLGPLTALTEYTARFGPGACQAVLRQLEGRPGADSDSDSAEV